jgi:hypothetical protein
VGDRSGMGIGFVQVPVKKSLLTTHLIEWYIRDHKFAPARDKSYQQRKQNYL